ncbi:MULTISPECIES: hypothetical protein [unclassified Romboutsia]|uniref:hypothetical protein n=1 Tax=unclassified Romboutsia TaxID=2626894 RepID=UPI0008214823|nr:MULTISPECIES: hypothetical protein [unclassified Romboutsia]SCH31461.1 Uncharacterised protein [uncultured Clostridium sp.]
MSFINKCSTIIRRSSKDMFFITFDKDISYNYYDKNNEFLFSKKLIRNNSIDSANCFFNLDKFDNVYGIYNDGALKILTSQSGSSNFTQKELLKYNSKKFGICFPYINITRNDTHILYYVYNHNSANTCALFHHFKHNDVWTENKIDFINHIILDNFIVIWSYDSPSVFYFNLVNGIEEVFLSRFNKSTLTWSSPVQITNSRKNKIYLNVLKDSMNFYHLTFCENLDNGYSVKYLNGYLNDTSFDTDISTYITGPSTCMYPSFLKKDSTLYLMWVNFGKLHTSYSKDLGKSWSEHEIDEYSVENDFMRANFFSNYKDDLPYNVNTVFTSIDDVGILGF